VNRDLKKQIRINCDADTVRTLHGSRLGSKGADSGSSMSGTDFRPKRHSLIGFGDNVGLRVKGYSIDRQPVDSSGEEFGYLARLRKYDRTEQFISTIFPESLA